ncbi:DUF6059 family protein [Streptomyces montanisoli]|uniref:Uncharacterized protein n=1 Tax=Streptomyces montanisoli TaxID=2798581 RepID=A0A940RYR2_9ACTN|nr:DUF6059 family protein [Streptomyces montanisoli]MBP0461830.1 hypothetical protein [Streptomyces montanisoli]
MAATGWLRQSVGRLLRAVDEVLVAYGDRMRAQLEVDEGSTAAVPSPYGYGGRGRGPGGGHGPGGHPIGPDGPPPGHPERLCPELPLTAQEVALMRDLGIYEWPRAGSW